MKRAKTLVKKLLPTSTLKSIRPVYHGLKGYIAAAINFFPAARLEIISVTGTKGKTTTSAYIGRLLNTYGLKTGYITTSVINLGKEEFLNPHKMTSIDSFEMHKYLAKMKRNGCKRAVIEMSSQGLEQNRHKGLFGFTAGVFLNIYPEHIEAHGNWEKYKHAKSILFRNIRKNGVFLANKDFAEYQYMWRETKPKLRSTIHKKLFSLTKDITIKNSNNLTKNLIYKKQNYPTNLISDFDIQNAYAASISIANILGKTTKKRNTILEKILVLLPELKTVPGRMEWVIKEGKNVYNEQKTPYKKNLSILVDYAHEPASMEFLLKTVKSWQKKSFDNTIHILSCDGVGRDDWKKPIMGKISRKYIDYTIFTTDNFEIGDKPQAIIDSLTAKITLSDKTFSEKKRSKAFQKALEIASKLKGKTLIVSTGVGSEQGLTHPSGTVKWDEREQWINAYRKFSR